MLDLIIAQGDFKGPRQLITDLADLGIQNPESISHVSSSLDDHGLFLPEEGETVVQRRRGLDYTGVYIARDGSKVPFKAFSGQQLADASAFLMAAAEIGLFPKPGLSRTFPEKRISLHRLIPQPYTIRHPVRADLSSLKQLNQMCQPSAMRISTAEIKRRVSDCPREQMVLEFDGQIAAVLYAQRIDSIEALRSINYAEVGRLYRPEGSYLQLLGLFVAPEMYGRGFSDALVDLMRIYGPLLDGVEAIMGVTRCDNYRQHRATYSLDQYIQLRDEQGQLVDPMLHFHASHGAVICEVLPGFRPGDTDNEEAGVLIEYGLHAEQKAIAKPERPQAVSAPHTKLAADQVEPIVHSTVIEILGSQRAAAYDPQTPLMEMGLRSLELLELRRQLSTRLGESLPSTFFFSYGTSEAVIGYFMAQANVQQPMPQTIAAPTLEASVAPAHVDYASANNGPQQKSTHQHEAVAIIGLACRLPHKANNPAQLWQELLAARDEVGALPANRRLLWGNRAEPCRWQGGFLDDVDCFDAGFFRISPREAELLDPQQRLLLEVAWEALESAAIAPAMLRGTRSGVFVGMMSSDYEDVIASNGRKADINAHFATGNACSVAAGRLSYFFDWQGPALSIDTACSSSLVAVHTACRSLLGGECNLVLAAGVNLLLDEKRFLAYEQAGMLSPDGRCKTFDALANGYVRGEGCAAVILKRLSDAQADGDPIIAVIRGSAINQDGSSSGLTAPNQLSQQAVIEAALAQAEVAPHEIGYLEAHGTGTKLGDPIEVMAAAQVLGTGRPDDQPLLIGSLKSVMGHLEAAAGIAGLIKTVLSMQQDVIPAQLHFVTPNPHIPWERLPVQVVAHTQAWPAGLKRAGVSSFGFSGTNAHVIVEEYVEPQKAPTEVIGPVVVVLSAKNEERLRDQAQQLLSYLEHRAQTNLVELAYTLQVGREALGVRLALVVRSINELKERLLCYMQDEALQENTYQGELKRSQEALAERANEDSQKLIEASLALSQLDKLAQFWVQGLEVEWAQIYGQMKPQRISLPTYPFAKERYWVPQTAVPEGSERQLHPLVHRNTSSLRQQCFSTTLTGEEFFLCDHVVQGERIVPGAAQLEWARAAVMLASEDKADMAESSVLLQEVTWLRRLVVREPQEVHIGLEEEEDARIHFEIYSGSGDKRVVYSRGWAQLTEVGEAPRIDLKAVREQGEQTLTGEACYARFAQLGFNYGPSFQVLHELQLGRHIAVGALHSAAAWPAGYAWAPNMLDGALQLCVGFAPGAADASLALPFAVEQVKQWGKVPTSAWVIVQSGTDDSVTIRKFNVDIVDASGRVVLRLNGFSTRPLHEATEQAVTPPQTVLFAPQWTAQTTVQPTVTLVYQRHGILLCEMSEDQSGRIAELAAAMPAAQCVGLIGSGTLAQRYTSYAVQLLEWIQKEVAAYPGKALLLQLLVFIKDESMVLQGLGGLLRSAQREYPLLTCQVVAVESEISIPILAQYLQAESASPAPMVRYVEGKREVLGFVPLAPAVEETMLPWRDKGVYLITGGLGGLGQVFARAITQQVRQPVLVLTGRSALKSAQEPVLQELQTMGAQVVYRAIDVSNAVAVAALVREIVAQYEQLNGVIHSAGVLYDGLLAQKSSETLRQVLVPKVAGLVALDEATKGVMLDWLVLCSSVMGVWGNIGQADYAVGNSFLDAYAHYRTGLVEQGQRHGLTVSVSWPLWAEGGMQLDAAAQERLRKETGLEAMPNAAGVAALCQALMQNAAHVVVGYGVASRILQHLQATFEMSVSLAAAEGLDTELSEVAADELPSQIEHVLTGLISAQLKIAREELDRDTPLNEFGFDSITLTELGDTLHQKYGLALSPTIFFEYPTIAALAGYLAREHQAVFAPAFTATITKAVQNPSEDTVVSSPFLPTSRRRQRPTAAAIPRNDVSEGNTLKNEPIAVIGMSGCFPKAEDIDTLWTNLLSEQDSIGVLPGNRWNRGPAPSIRHAGVIESIDEFDPLFFGISPREAQAMDPQQRLLMLYVYRVIEDAGYSVRSLSGSNTALLVGTAGTGYGQLLAQAGETVAGYSASGVWVAMGPNRMSHWLNWHGPSEPIDTACSSSLVAVHRALELLRSGQCDQAVVGGVNTLLSMELHESFTQAGMLSPDGRCKTFSAQANGYVRGEGAGMVFLKPLSAAQRDGDHIYGLLKGSAINHGGRANSLTAPNPRAQADLIKAALQQAEIAPETVGYIEAHGTGTSLGDPIEVQGLKSAFAELAPGLSAQSCGLGSVKSNIGHLELAAGVVGLIKVLLQLQHRTLVKSLHCEKLNPLLALDNSPFYVVQQTRPWEALRDRQGQALPRRAGVSSFGFGGVNAHVIVEEYIEPQRVPTAVSGPVVVVLSAKNEARLQNQAQQLLAYLESHAETNVVDLAYTLQVGREALGVRLALVVQSINELKERLLRYGQGEVTQENTYQGETKRSKELLALFDDEEIRKAIEVWIAKGKFSKLAQLWVQGLEIEWKQLYGQTNPRRISLPTYPFAKERYWVPQTVVRRDTEHVEIEPVMTQPEAILLATQWKTQAIAQPTTVPVYGEHGILLCEVSNDDSKAVAELAAAVPAAQCVRLTATGTLAQRYTAYATQLLDWIQQGIATYSGRTRLLQLVISSTGEGAVLQGLGGLLRSAQKEYLLLVCQVVAVEMGISMPVLVQRLHAEAASPAPMVRYIDGQREVWDFASWESEASSILPWRNEGVYLITGGLGGLGQVFARVIAQQIHHPVLVLTGRSALKPTQESILQELQKLGARVLYRAVDVSDAAAVAALVREIVGQYGQLNGIIHSAGVLRDGLLAQKTGETLRQVLAPKVAGLVALDEATREVELDWLVLCSSMTGVWGNIGQANYAVGNSFLDAYAHYRTGLVEQGQRHGLTVSVSWPLWVEGGMQLDAAAQERLRKETGLEAMPNAAGVAALCQVLMHDAAHVVVGYGVAAHILQHLQTTFEAPVSLAVEEDLDAELGKFATNELQLRIEQVLTGLISTQLKIAREELERDASLHEFGFNSITLTELSSVLQQKYGLALSPTIFFEYPTIAALAGYLAREHQAVFAPTLTTKTKKAVQSHSEDAAPISQHQQKRIAVATLRDDSLESKSRRNTLNDEPIAVIGMSGCFPQAEDIDALWANLLSGQDSIEMLPANRWDHGLAPSIRHAGVIKSIDEFDPLFFGISPPEAQAMDPQQRLLMLYVYRVIQDAGYSMQSLSGSNTALLVGTCGTGYGQLLAQAGNAVAWYSAAGLAGSMGPNRMSHWLNWHGPSEPIDTACSSSLVAVHRALELLRSGQCTQAVAGGINTLLSMEAQESLAQAGMLSPVGRCKTFSAKADGYVRGEGVGMVFLKPLSAAQRDGDHIYGLLKGSATNHGGRANSLTAPNPRAQANLIKAALQQAEVAPETVSYIEAHGTGTSLGDPIEVQGLKSAFAELATELPLGYCGLGSVKSNIGHLEMAAGVAGLIKVLLQLQHRTLVKSLHCEELNPLLALDNSPFYVVQQARPWEALRDRQGQALPRRAGVSSFGFGGVNAHVIVEEYVEPQRASTLFNGPVVVLLSARSEEPLRSQVQHLLAYLERQAEVNLADLVYTLQVGRDALGVRLALVVRSLEELKEKLSRYVRGEVDQEDAYHGKVTREQDIFPMLRADEEFQETVNKWIARGKLGKLAQLWVQGLEFEWRQLYGQTKPKRISLPTYPFSKERYWVSSLQSETHDNRPPATPSFASTAAPPTTHVRLVAALSEISGLPAEQIDPHADFEQLGLDSLKITELNRRIATWTGKNDATLLFKYKTLADLAAYLAPQIGVDTSGNTLPSASQPGAAHHSALGYGYVNAKTDHAHDNDDAIAIIGMSGRYPQAETLDVFWANLVGGMDCVTEIPRDRFDYREVYRSGTKGKTGAIYCKWGGFLSDISQFDAAFFKLSAKDAALMDPQERQFLEMAWICLESSGYLDARWQSRPRDFGVFAGVSFNDYQLIGADVLNARAPFYSASSQTYSIANRISFFFNFTGPSVVVDTACASSLYALHLACESLRNGETEAVLAGGVNLILHPSKYLTLCESGFAASDGRCHAFTEGGDGYVPSEGVGVVLLKRYADAIKAGDTVLALIKGTGVSHDGKTQGFTVPNPVSQTKAIKAALARSKVSADTISYIEAHGTGTALGDPVEMQGLMDAYPAEINFSRAIGSVKANIGHSEAAAGIAQLTKTVLQLQHKMLTPTLLHGPLNPNISFEKAGFYVPGHTMPWPVIERNGRALPRRAGISSFGAGGVNVHMILEEALITKDSHSEPYSVRGPANSRNGVLPLILPLSAQVPTQLAEQARQLVDFLDSPTSADHALHDVAFTLQFRKPAFRYRLALIVQSRVDAIRQLRDWLAASDAECQNGPYRGDSLDGVQQPLIPPFPTDPHVLAQAWVIGSLIEWLTLESQNGVSPVGQFVPLPSYPFLTKRCWISDVLAPEGATAAKLPSINEDVTDLDRWLMQIGWSEAEWNPEPAVPTSSPIVVLCEDDEVLHRWAAGRKDSVHLLTLDRNDTFGERLSHSLRSGEYDTFIFVQPHASLITVSTNSAMLDAAFQTRAEQLTRLVKRAVDWAGQRKGLKLILVNLTHRGETDPVQEALSRYFSFLRFEVPEIGSLIIDVDSLEEDRLNWIYSELHCTQADTRVRLHDGKRLCQRLRPLSIKRIANSLDPSGAMILTGGFGGIGLTLLHWLVDKGVKQLIVIGRKPTSSVLQHPSLPSGTRIQDFIDELARTHGVMLWYIQSDLRDEEALECHITDLRATIGMPITGIFHLAGITTDAIPIRETTADILSDVVRPKLAGAYCLDRLTRNDPVRYFCLFSSVSSVEGMQGHGLSAYAAANAALVGLATTRRREGRPTQVIQWTDWDGAGMAVKHNHRAFFDALGISMLTPEQGVILLERILVQNVGESIVFDADWHKFAQVNRAVQRLPVFSYYAAQLGNVQPRSEDNTVEDTQVPALGTEIIDVLLNQLSILLGQDDLHPDQTFAEIGLDSINSLTFFSNLSDQLSLEILPSVVFRYPTIRELARFLGGQRGNSALTSTKTQIHSAGKTSTTPLSAPDGSHTSKTGNNDSIGIIGMSGQFPQAPDLPTFWTRLTEKFDGVKHYPSARRDLLGLNDSFTDKDLATVFGGYLDDIDLFDPGFFNISPREARLMDPQQRLLMLNAHRAIEDAGIRKQANFANTGVFIAAYASEYMQFVNGYDKENALFIATGNASAIAANRLSYHYGFKGLSLVLDTACSSTLVALDVACQYLHSGQIDFALVGGISLNLNPDKIRLLQKANMLSPTGKCHTFDACADGYVPGEGVGMIVLQRFDEAGRHRTQSQQPRIYAMVAGSAINQDGKSNGMTAPNGLAQEEVIRAAFQQAGLSPAQAGYIETHGTGTYLGDPVEMEALGNVLNKDRPVDRPCILGCLKTNIGHLEPAAGIAGVIKAALCLYLEKIPANNHLDTINPLFKIPDPGFQFPDKPIQWSGPGRIAGVSSFGFGGVNGHVVLTSVDQDSHLTTGLDRERHFLDTYPATDLTLKSYWVRRSENQHPAVPIYDTASTATAAVQFLPLIHRPSATETLCIELILRPDEDGLMDTGNFHVGFYLDVIYRIFSQYFNRSHLAIRRFEFLLPLLISPKTDTKVQVKVEDEGQQGYRVTFYYQPIAAKTSDSLATANSIWTKTAQARVETEHDANVHPSEAWLAAILEERLGMPQHTLDEMTFYGRYTAMGFPAEGFVRAVRECHFYDRLSLATLQLDFGRDDYGLGAHPGFIDAALQPSILLADTDGDLPYMTTVMENIWLSRSLARNGEYQLVSVLLPQQESEVSGNVPGQDGARCFATAWAIVDNQGQSVITCGLARLQQLGQWNRKASKQLDALLNSGDTLTENNLLTLVAELLDCEQGDIDLDKALLDLGMDSLMLMKLQKQLSNHSIPIKNLFQSSLRDLVVQLQSHNLAPDKVPASVTESACEYTPFIDLKPWSRERNAWIRGQAQEKTRIRLYCFPYSHMSSAVFNGWQERLPDHIEVRPIELPGRGDRFRERPFQDVWTLASTLTDLLGDELEQPYALYGHSAGALMAYVWTLNLRASGLPLPKHLFAAAYSAPIVGTENPLIRNMRLNHRQHGLDCLPTLDDICDPNAGPLLKTVIDALEHSIREVRIFNFSRDLIYTHLPALLSTLRMVETFQADIVQPLPIPVSGLHGTQDIQVQESEVLAWQQLCNSFTLRCFDGDHLFIKPDQSMGEVLSYIGETLIT